MSAFVSKRGTTRIPIAPEEFPCLDKEEWIEITNGATVDMMSEIGTNGTGTGTEVSNPMIHFIQRAVVGWSFDEPLTIENMKDLDIGIALFVWEAIQEHLPLALRAQLPQTTDV
jgi:hypothetical protein